MKTDRKSLDILEEAGGLLRATPVRVHAAYLIGALPFTLGLLYFLADMTRSPFAFEHLSEASLGVAALYAWKQAWQSVFASGLHETLTGQSLPWTADRLSRLVLIQTSVQPLALVVIPIACLLTIPFAHVFAFFRNLTLYAGLPDSAALPSARAQAFQAPKQNWFLLGLVTLAALALFANFEMMILLLPMLARSFFGIEGDMARLGSGMLNSTTLTAAAALTWLAVDPLLDAVYVLRCYYGESVATGEDLLAALRRVAAAGVILAALAIPTGLRAQSVPTASQPSGQTIDSSRLDKSMQQVIRRREFTWRTPVASGGDAPKGRWTRWAESLINLWNRFFDWIGNILDEWLKEGKSSSVGGDAPATRRELELLIGILIALFVGVVMARRLWKRPVIQDAKSVTLAATVNLADESLTADQLSESSWLALAEEWLAKNDCRLALRALYLAGLNYLGGRNLISIRRWKSGLDYTTELDRRARPEPQLSRVFAANLGIFERGWYGRHDVDRESVRAFTAGLDEIRSHAERL